LRLSSHAAVSPATPQPTTAIFSGLSDVIGGVTKFGIDIYRLYYTRLSLKTYSSLNYL
jgi:hypothetical protein